MDLSGIGEIGYLFSSLLTEFMPVILVITVAGFIFALTPAGRKYLKF